MKRCRISALLLLLASLSVKSSAVPLNGTAVGSGELEGVHDALILPRMDPAIDLRPLADTGAQTLAHMHVPLQESEDTQRMASNRRFMLASGGGWTRVGKTANSVPPVVQDLMGYKGIEGVAGVRGHAVQAINQSQPELWRMVDYTQDNSYSAAEGLQPSNGWTYNGVYNSKFRVIVVTQAYSPTFMTTLDPRPQIPAVNPAVYDWSDVAYLEYTNGSGIRNNRIRPPLVYIPRVIPGSEDHAVIETVLQLLQQPLRPKPGVTFPIGSWAHRVLLSTETGQQVAAFLINHKKVFGISTVAAIHIWGSGYGDCSPSVIFSNYHHDDWVKEAEKLNGEQQGDEDYPRPLKPLGW